MKRERSVIETPLGRLALIAHDDKLAAVDWTEEDAGPAPPDDDDHLLTLAAAQIAAYFAGDLHRFDLPLAPAGTPFRQKVWSAMLEVPYGQTTTYGDVARSIGGGPRAVGGACGANPIPIIIPCHRVLASSGLGGYSGRGGLDVKQFLLRHEARHRLR
jgi:methylated-DNA-[protein]-cysteine S-methyltransferase